MRLLPTACILIVALIGTLSLHQLLHDHAQAQSIQLLHQILNGINKEISRNTIDLQSWASIIKADEKTNHLRLTIIDSNGHVIADNHGNPAQMDNHLLRPEIKAATKSPGNTGSSIRTSRSIGLDYIYLAHAYQQNQETIGYIRLALPQSIIEKNATRPLIAILIPCSFLLLIIGVMWHALLKRHEQDLPQPAASPLPYRQTRHESTEEERVIWQKDRAFNLPAMLNSLSEGIIAVNSDEQVVYLNHAAIRILHTTEEDALGRSVWDISRINIIPETIHQCITQRTEQFHNFQVLQQTREANYGLHVTPVTRRDQQEQENIYAAVAIIDDVSHEHRINSIRRNFFTNVSHELKTPLAVIRGVLETMLDDPDMPKTNQTSFIAKAFAQSERLSHLVGDLLTLSRLEDLDDIQDREPLSLRGLLRECVNNLNNRAEQKHITLELKLPEDNCNVHGDRELLQQAIDNLLSNAINYSPDESTVTAILETGTTEYIIQIVDNGPGIPPHALERIFERFFRVDKARSRQVGGTGLGLSIAKHAVALHGGSISVQSEVSKGSTFIIKLPLSLASGAEHVISNA